MIKLKPKETIILKKTFDHLTRKDWFKMIALIENPYYCDALIVQLEARRKQLKPYNTAEKPR